MKRGIVRLLCVAALGLALFNGVAGDGCCGDAKAVAADCGACCCAPRAAPETSVKLAAAPAASAYASYEAPAYAFLPPPPILRPPCLAA